MLILQSEPLIPFRTGGAVRLRCAARLPLRCHLHINGSPKQALLPLDFGTGNWKWVHERSTRYIFSIKVTLIQIFRLNNVIYYCPSFFTQEIVPTQRFNGSFLRKRQDLDPEATLPLPHIIVYCVWTHQWHGAVTFLCGYG